MHLGPPHRRHHDRFRLESYGNGARRGRSMANRPSTARDKPAGTDLRDAMGLKQHQGAFPGTYQRGAALEKIDYSLLSPALRKKVEHVDVFRESFHSPREWESFENITGEDKHRFQASDHHCVWAQVET